VFQIILTLTKKTPFIENIKKLQGVSEEEKSGLTPEPCHLSHLEIRFLAFSPNSLQPEPLQPWRPCGTPVIGVLPVSHPYRA